MIEATLDRFEDDGKQTLGVLTIGTGNQVLYMCKTLELPWRDNANSISCVPAGTYKVKKYSSETYPGVYELQDVPGRSKILIHWGNYNRNTQGCILVGSEHKDIDGDGLRDVRHSRKTLRQLKNKIDYKEFELTILDPTS